MMKTKILGMTGAVISSDELSETQQPKQTTRGIMSKTGILGLMGAAMAGTGLSGTKTGAAFDRAIALGYPFGLSGHSKTEKSKNGGTQSGAANLKRAAKRRNNIRKHKG